MKKKVLILLSGGIDSVTALYSVLKEHDVIAALSFDYGSKHNANEIPYAQHHCKKWNIHHEVLNIDFIGKLFKSSLLLNGEEIPEGHYEAENMKSTVVPFRNGIMLSIACGYAESIGAEGLVIGTHSGDHAIYPDCRSEFMNAMGAAMQSGTYVNIELMHPFLNVDKTEIVRIGHQLEIDYEQTWSCYKGGVIHCGKCGTCIERKEAFQLSGINDPTIYELV